MHQNDNSRRIAYMTGKTKELVLCFLNANSQLLADSYLNRWAAKVAPRTKYNQPPQVHVELLFRDDTELKGMSCSICYNQTVHYQQKRFSRSNWTFRSIYVTPQAYTRVKTWCQMRRGEKFNRLGFYLLAIGWRISGSWPTTFNYKHTWYCAELIATALQIGNVLPNTMTMVMHPEELYQYLSLTTTPTTIRNWDESSVSY